ncbi:hypothetical protein [Pseudoalteromonas sp. 68 DY56-GL68]|uniref:hypothetical protein n=1 Tax=Pseudoalteromonas sp. 68 DY56-GL68 TaxID=2974919 RepID=UPI00352B5065
MAGVNNQPNLRPLIDEQTEIQKLDLTWLKSVAAANRTKLDQTLADVAEASENVNAKHVATQQAVASAKAETAQAITDKQALTDAAVTAAKDALLADLLAKNTALMTELSDIKAKSDFDVKSIGKIQTESMAINHADLNGVIFSRSGKGAIVAIQGSHRNTVKVFADGVLVLDFNGVTSSDYNRDFMTGGGFEYIKYHKTIEVQATPEAASSYQFFLTDKKVY